MFPFRRKPLVDVVHEAVVATLASTPAPQSIPIPSKKSLDCTEEYKELAVKLGIMVTEAVYPLAGVIEYLDFKFPKSKEGNRGWVWSPLRQKDIVKGISFNDTERTYRKPIPLAVLITIDELQTKYPAAKFFISDERHPGDEKDPFLLFTVDDGRTLNVVERWDEPSFR